MMSQVHRVRAQPSAGAGLGCGALTCRRAARSSRRTPRACARKASSCGGPSPVQPCGPSEAAPQHAARAAAAAAATTLVSETLGRTARCAAGARAAVRFQGTCARRPCAAQHTRERATTTAHRPASSRHQAAALVAAGLAAAAWGAAPAPQLPPPVPLLAPAPAAARLAHAHAAAPAPTLLAAAARNEVAATADDVTDLMPHWLVTLLAIAALNVAGLWGVSRFGGCWGSGLGSRGPLALDAEPVLFSHALFSILADALLFELCALRSVFKTAAPRVAAQVQQLVRAAMDTSTPVTLVKVRRSRAPCQAPGQAAGAPSQTAAMLD